MIWGRQRKHKLKSMKAPLHMLRILPIAIFLSTTAVFAQQPTCHNKLDSAGVKRIAFRHNAWWTNNEVYPPSMELNPVDCIWSVCSTKSKRTEKGDCKYTNGCTEVTKVTLVIDASKKRVIRRSVETHLYHNYE